MSQENYHPRISAQRGAEYIRDLSMIQPESGWPITVIPSVAAPRSDSGEALLKEGYSLTGLRMQDGVIGTITACVSPHTLRVIPREDFLGKVGKMTGKIDPMVPFEQDTPAHLLVWWFQDEGDKLGRIDILKMAEMPEEQRRNVLSVIARETTTAVKLLEETCKPDKSQGQEVEIYGVFGHATAAEIQETGLGRGAQSSPHGHLNVAYFDYHESRRKAHRGIKPTSRELLKQYGIWDKILFDDISGSVYEIVNNVAERRLGPGKVKLNYQTDYRRETDEAMAPHYEGYLLDFGENLDMEDAMLVLTDITGHFNRFYEGLLERFGAYHKNYADDEARDKIVRDIKNFAESLGFHGPAPEYFAELIETMKPTYGQLRHWIEEKKKDGVSETDPSYKHLSAAAKRYEEIARRLFGPERDVIVEEFMRHYEVDEEEAEMMIRFTMDKLINPKERDYYNFIEFVMPRHLSGSFVFGDHKIDENGKLQVRQLSLATRIGSTKGVIEDMIGVIIRRLEAGQRR